MSATQVMWAPADADASVEYARTVASVSWLVGHPGGRDQLQAVADALAAQGTRPFELMAGREGYESEDRRLPCPGSEFEAVGEAEWQSDGPTSSGVQRDWA